MSARSQGAYLQEWADAFSGTCREVLCNMWPTLLKLAPKCPQFKSEICVSANLRLTIRDLRKSLVVLLVMIGNI